MKIVVTKEDIRRAEDANKATAPHYFPACPFDYPLQRLVKPHVRIGIEYDFVAFMVPRDNPHPLETYDRIVESGEVVLPSEAVLFLKMFSMGAPLDAFEFDLEIPAEVLA